MSVLHPSHGGSAAAFGIDTTRTGLLCRADMSCRAAFQVGRKAGGMNTAVIAREHHERLTHSYVHVPLAVSAWSYGTLMTHGGHSTLGRKKKVV